MGDFSHLKNKKGELIAQPLPQPTLPNLSVDDDMDDVSSMRTRGPPPSTYTQDYYDYKSEYTSDYPPMPAYNQSQHDYHNHSNATFVDDEHYQHNVMYDDDQGSTAHLAVAAAPFAQNGHDRNGSNPYGSSGMNGSYVADPHDVYQGRAIPSGDFSRRSPQPQGGDYHNQGGGAYGGYDEQDYPSPTSARPGQQQHQTFGAAHTHLRDDSYNGYDYDGQGHAERGGGHGGGGYTPHAM